MKSPTYWHPFLYELSLRASLKRSYRKRYEAVAGLIGPGRTVVDICCGDCKIHSFLKGADYLGLDFNRTFVKSALARGINAREFDVRRDPIPAADDVLMIASLYQFIPDHLAILKKAYAAAEKRLILCEPVRNHADSRNRLLSWAAKWLNDPGNGVKKARLDLPALKETLRPFQDRISREFFVPGEIEYVVVIERSVRGPG